MITDTRLPPLSEARFGHSSYVCGDDLLTVFCGFGVGPLSSIEVLRLPNTRRRPNLDFEEEIVDDLRWKRLEAPEFAMYR